MNLIHHPQRLCLVLFLLFVKGTFPAAAETTELIAVSALTAEHHFNPVGIDAMHPRFSWIIKSRQQNTYQTAWQIQVAASPAHLANGNLIWDAGRVSSSVSVLNRYQGPELESARRYYWRVRVWDNHGNTSPWSEVAFWEMGLLDAGDWLAEWIEPGLEEDTAISNPAPMLRREFETKGKILSARAYVTSHGLYEMYINGRRVGQEFFTPGWTSYPTRLQYQTWDVTTLIQQGRNATGVVLGDGWFRGFIGWGDQRNYYGEKLALLAQIVITYEDGTKQIVVSDGDWKVSTGPILRSDIYNGEEYDARLEKEGWNMPGFNDSAWKGVTLADHDKNRLTGRHAPPVLAIQEIEPVNIFTTPQGDIVADMGQNMIGWIRLQVQGPAGTRVTLRHAEVLDSEGNFYTENLRSADQTNTYILKGGAVEVWEPAFTFQGFRYVAIDGFPGQLTPGNLTGVVLHSEMEPTGHFQCSHPLVNQLQHNIIWGQKGNFLDVPTDCPQRDERMGWTGDIQVFAPTANINMNTAGFLTKWLGDLAADQNEAGSVSHVVPNVLGEGAYGSAGWGDAALIVPWSMYRYFGDRDILEKQYESMKAWVNYMSTRAATNENRWLWDVDFSFADWLSYSTSSDPHYPGAYTDFRMVATMFFAHSTDLLRQSAEILGKDDDAREYAELFEKIKAAFQHEYLTPGGRIMSDTQTAYLLALRFNLLPEDKISKAVSTLVNEVSGRNHLTTGFLGTPHLNPVLSSYGHDDLAYRLLLRETYPSWLYPVIMGATTIWERWDGIKPDGTFQSEQMNSFNHYAYGAIGQWLFEQVAGISPSGAGYRTIRISPTPGGGLSHARAIINSVHGRIESSWELEGDRFTLNVEVPANSSALVVLPDARLENIGGSPGERTSNPGLTDIVQDGSDVLVSLGSGKYSFVYVSEALAARASIGVSSDSVVSGPDSKIGELLAVRQSRDILYRHLPELTTSPWLSQVMGFTLKQAMFTLPDHFRVSDDTINRIYMELESMGGY
jgi:alpha-L-rhamnosidase